MLVKHFKKAAIALVPVFLMGNVIRAQFISKVSTVSLFDKTITPPATAQEAFSKCQFLQTEGKYSAAKLYEASNNELLGYIKANSALNAENQQRNMDAMKLNTQMQKDHVQGMTDAQKFDYIRNNVAGKEGASSSGIPSQGTMDFAKQMQNPAFQEKFKNMSQQEKMTYMQNAGVVPQQNSFIAKDAGVQSTQQAFMEKMKDPAFREEWKKKDKQQQDVYMKQLMAENNVDFKKLAKEGRAEAATTPAPEKRVLGDLNVIAQKMLTDENSATTEYLAVYSKRKTESDARHSKINDDGKAQVEKLPFIGNGEGGPYRDGNKVKAIEKAAMDRHVKQAEEDLKNDVDFWITEKEKLKTLTKPFDDGLQQIHYGDDVKNEAEKKSLAFIASAQSSLFNNMTGLNKEAQDLVENALYWFNLQKQYGQGKSFPFNYGE